ncbi:nitrous oxide reductase family maturation protein NosD [Paenibacillus sp. 1P07SE]|uniref:right-handed parallel beta-helix repeat-containing protein n=1 Tax=Paenibacillus sp. 1P07SE TaxID=3132209 RepID=UPI0039A5C400
MTADIDAGRQLAGWIRRGLLVLVLTAAAAGAARDTAADTGGTSLQERIDQAIAGERLTIPAGTYEGAVVIDKPLVLEAERAGAVVLLHRGEGSALRIEAADVTVSGLRILDETVKTEPTVLVAGDRVRLEGLEITTVSDGIQLRGVQGGELRGNVIAWSDQSPAREVRLAAKGNGIDGYDAHRHVIAGNRIRDMHDGIYLENSDDNEVTDNELTDSRYGIHCMYTKGTRIIGNRGEGNVTGAMVMNTRDVEIAGNTFAKQNENVNSQGLLLFDAHGTLVRHNELAGNRVGIYIEQSADNRIEANRIMDNYTGIQLISATGNTLRGNELTGNMADAQARGSADNEITGNFWDAHRGIDYDGDGYSDTAYAVNPLFAGIVQRRQQLQLLFQSPGMVFLEELYQADRATWTTDRAPLMAPPMREEPGAPGAGGWQTGLAGMGLVAATGFLYYVARRREG